MPTTEVNLPDGSNISVNHPENATELNMQSCIIRPHYEKKLPLPFLLP